MNIKKIFLILCLSAMVFACVKETLEKDFMIGSWQTTYLKIDMVTAHQSDSLEVYEDTFQNNPELIAQSQYNKDGTFSAWFINQNKEKISESSGTWHVVKDSLFVAFSYKGRAMQVSYQISETEEGFIGKSKYDWDEDGDFDDLLTMKTERIKK